MFSPEAPLRLGSRRPPSQPFQQLGVFPLPLPVLMWPPSVFLLSPQSDWFFSDDEDKGERVSGAERAVRAKWGRSLPLVTPSPKEASSRGREVLGSSSLMEEALVLF